MYLGNSHKIIFSITCSCVIAFARIIESKSAIQSKMDTQTAGYQNKLLGAVVQTDYTGGLDCLRRRLVRTCGFRNAPQSRFRCRDPNQCLPNFLKMLLLALPQIYTHVFHLWKTIDLDSAWVRNSRPYQPFFLS